MTARSWHGDSILLLTPPSSTPTACREIIVSASRVPVVVADRVVVPAGTTSADAVAAAGLPTSGPKAIVVVKDGTRPAARPGLGARGGHRGGTGPGRLPGRAERAAALHRHVLAQAVQDVFPEAKLGIGPPIENGFYYDFSVSKPFQPDDLQKLESVCRRSSRLASHSQRRPLRLVDRPRRNSPDEPFKLLQIVRLERLRHGEVVVRSRSRSAARCPASPRGRRPAPPGPARARWSAASTFSPSGESTGTGFHLGVHLGRPGQVAQPAGAVLYHHDRLGPGGG